MPNTNGDVPVHSSDSVPIEVVTTFPQDQISSQGVNIAADLRNGESSTVSSSTTSVRDGSSASSGSSTESPPDHVPKHNFVHITDVHPDYPRSNLKLPDRHIDNVRTLKVIVVGAGMAGIVSGILLPAKVPKIELHILEKNYDVGGTWLENVYPGVRCDIPAHVYQATFAPNTQWSQQFAPGDEICQYWAAQARKYDVYKYITFGRRVTSLSWDETRSQWVVASQDVKSGQKHLEDADFVLTAIGRFNSWQLPKYPGISDYQGYIRHTSNWEPSFDATGKNVAILGNGASGIQVVPTLQRLAKHVDHYARNKTWIAASWAGDERTFEPQWIPEDKKQSFADPEVYIKFRKELESKYWRRFPSTFRNSAQNSEMRERFINIMSKRTQDDPELVKSLIPTFSPNCRRLTPGPGYLEALTAPNVSFIQTPIKRFTATGIETIDGKHRPVDAVLCATGAAVDLNFPFSVTAHGTDLRDLWSPDNPTGKGYGWPYSYLGLAVPSFPNLFFIHGPHATGPSGTVPHSLELQLTYYSKVLRKVSSQGIKTITPSKAATDDFVEYCDAFFPKTVLSENCSSWMNGGRAGSRIHGIWPGSAGHITWVRKEPRWEDWEYEYLDDDQGNKVTNRFANWLGNGWTQREKDEDTDMTPYLRLESVTGKVNLKNLHEEWWEYYNDLS
ncbi:hypothetical protein DV737_g2550, partial [Chaetothyriales sp. CBS 132003]